MLIWLQSHRSLYMQARLLEQNPPPDRSYPGYLADHHLHPDHPVPEHIFHLFPLSQTIP